MPKGTPVTAYPYVLKTDCIAARTRNKLGNDYAYQWPNGDVLDAHPELLRHRGNRVVGCCYHPWGVGHLANDAVHPELTGKTNNCVFFMRQSNPHRLYLVTDRAVRKGEELFVPYSLDYWVSRWKTAPTPKMCEWLGYHARIATMVRDMTSVKVELDEYLGTVHMPGDQVPPTVREALGNDNHNHVSCRVMYTVTFGKAPKGCVCKTMRCARRIAIWAWTECTTPPRFACAECDVCKCVIGDVHRHAS